MYSLYSVIYLRPTYCKVILSIKGVDPSNMINHLQATFQSVSWQPIIIAFNTLEPMDTKDALLSWISLSKLYIQSTVEIQINLVQVNLCQKLLFLHQVTNNMTTDCSLSMKMLSSEYLQNMLCTQIVVFVLTFRTILLHNMFCRCSELLKKIYL